MFIVKVGMYSNKGMGNLNSVRLTKMTIWCKYRFTFEQMVIFCSNCLYFV